MSFQDRRMEARPAKGEAPFQLEEVFFSRTDDRGVIQSANYVFRRVANYEWEEMLGAPHKLIRHPDMPKGVFWLLWDRLKQGLSVGAYVKNQAKDGLYYWVFAVVMPCPGGYISARIKPSSEILATVAKEYAALLKMEKEEGLSPEESAQVLLHRISDMGFESYSQFASHALAEELLARDEGMGREPDKTVLGFRKMLRNAEELLDLTNGLIKEFDAMRTIPHNLRVIASRIEPAGGPVTVLSQNYGTMSREMSEWFETHVLGEKSNFASIGRTVHISMLTQCMARILSECDKQLQSERRQLSGIDMDSEREILTTQAKTQIEIAEKELHKVNSEADRILIACNVMHRHMLGLSSTRVLCKIESARLRNTGEALTDIIDQLGVFQHRISEKLDRIAQLSKEIRSGEED